MNPGEPARPGEDRIHHRVDDADDAGQLMRYALAAQLARLERHGIPQNAVARGAGSAPAKVTGSLQTPARKTESPDGRPNGKGTVPPAGEWLRNLDRAITAPAPDTESLGGLNSLGLRLRGLTREDTLPAHLPAGWTREILQEDADTEFAVLVQASALLALFMPVDHARRSSAELRQRYKKKIHTIAERLALIGGAPPSPRDIDALVLLGSLTKYAFDADPGDLIGGELRTSPLGFRHWRVVTKLVHLGSENLSSHSHLKGWVTRILDDAEELRHRSICPGRSLDLESAVAVPLEWSPPDTDRVRAMLIARATDPDATIRERGTAALGLWHRTLTQSPLRDEDPVQRRHVADVEAELRKVVAQFRAPSPRPDAAGLRWIAATLESVLDAGTPVCNTWPAPDPRDESWFGVVLAAADTLDTQDIPARILQPTKALFLHLLLQNAVTQRRKAIDALMTGGWTGAIVHALDYVLTREKEQTWLRVRALFVIGFLQRRDHTVARILVEACREARANLATAPTDARIREMHAVLFAIGDCFGAGFGARDRGNLKTVRAGTAPILRELATGELTRSDPRFHVVARALVYLLTFTAQDRRAGRVDLSEELLEALRDHPDETTREFCEWTLAFRFGADGKVRSLLYAADPDD